MASRKPKAGDAGIIDGCECKISFVGPDRVDFKCLERLKYEEELTALRAMPTDTEEVRKEYQKKGQAGPLEVAANKAKEKFVAAHEAKLPPMVERHRLVLHGHILSGGQRTSAHPRKVYWVPHAKAWTAMGRLLSRAEVVETHEVDGVIHDTHYDNEGNVCEHGEDGDCKVLEQSDRKRMHIHRKVIGGVSMPFDPAHEIAAHVALSSATGEA